MKNIDDIYELLRQIPVTKANKPYIDEIEDLLTQQEYIKALERMRQLKDVTNDETENEFELETKNDEDEIYPEKLNGTQLEYDFIGILLSNPKLIMKYYFLKEICLFKDEQCLNIYKSILFNEGAKYASEKAKDGFNFSKESEEIYNLKAKLKKQAEDEQKNPEKIYVELRKIFILRKSCLEAPERYIQDKIAEITDYQLYDKMSPEEIEDAIKQVNITQKFKQSILSRNLVRFLESGENELANGLDYPFPIITQVFKGIRKGETMAFAMPSNSGKSRLTIDIAAYTSLVHKKKVLVISNEMSEEKMKLCLITTILNNPEIQKIHGQKVEISETELLEFKFKPDNIKDAKLDENGYILKEEKETQTQFVQRLSKISSQFNKVITAIEWASKQMNNSIYFINITDHTNDELQKVITNYYYKEKIEYVFYDTLKTDTANIGNPEEIKKTATILSNLAQNFDMFICSSLQLSENTTMPINLNVNDLAVSKTVKEVLDTLCLFKQISRDDYDKYEYSKQEVDTKFFNLEKSKNPDVRYYACVIDKNRAGAKPKLVFKLNLAYNSWEELGYLKLK
jgi:replicative DNA helicase